jgi:cell division protein FtsQ
VLIGAAVVVVVLLLAVLAYAGPLLVVRSVEVSGVQGATAQQVRAAVGNVDGTPLARVDRSAVTARVGGVAAVAEVSVDRSWPSTLRVRVTPRVALAAVPFGGGYQLVDETGTAFRRVARAPKGVAVVRIPLSSGSMADADALRAAITALHALPAPLRGRVGTVSASSPDDVRLTLGRATVMWGSADDPELKARVLSAHTQQKATRKAKVFDVSSPHTPTVR